MPLSEYEQLLRRQPGHAPSPQVCVRARRPCSRFVVCVLGGGGGYHAPPAGQSRLEALLAVSPACKCSPHGSVRLHTSTLRGRCLQSQAWPSGGGR